jgi:hypothetical protein
MCPSACFERDNLLSNARSTHRRLPVNFEAFEWRERHQSSVVEPHVNTPELLHGRIHQSFHLLAIGNTFCSAMAMASAPAMKRRGAGSWPAIMMSAWASLAGSPDC